MKNVWIEGAATPLGRMLAEATADLDDVERVVAIEPEHSPDWHPRIKWLAHEADPRAQFAAMCEHEIDSVIQCSLAPDRMGDVRPGAGADVIGTMRLGAAVAREGSPVRSWVALSSTGVYPIDGGRPLLDRETHPRVPADDLRLGALLEAEDYAVDVAEHAPYLNVAILRLQEVVGEGANGALARHFGQTVVPTVIGHDPTLQFLHVDDAIEATLFAAERELAGCYNVASRGVMRESKILDHCEVTAIPSLPLSANIFEGLASRVGVPHITDHNLPILRFGHAVDTSKLEDAGFKPGADQVDCAEALRALRS
ncbi:MAG: NAD-dependent epimerase/dehydratase family protein [Myxococcota bacterium]|jgi:UDP-glucose 4-epimerase|nr:NAD-dependent epimerase/dehydratase family protein [Myxococcota bacterium]